MQRVAHEVLAYLQSQRQDMVELLECLARGESPSSDPAAQHQVLTLLTAELERIGLYTSRFRGRHVGDTLYARPLRPKKGVPWQLLVGHCDTVWPLGTLEQMPVRSGDGLVRGPGVFDMKGGLVQMIYALQTLKELRLPVPATPTVLINSDEEIGSPESTHLIRRLARRSARAFILEPALGKSGKLKTARKTVGRFTVIIRGRAAHAGINPEEGVSAILELSHQVQRLFALNDAARGVTVNVGTIDGGLRANVVAPEVKAQVDVRVPTQVDARRVEAAIRALHPVNPQATIEVMGGFGRPPMEPVPRNLALWRLARDLGQELGLDLDHAAVGGASDGNTTSLYTATLDGLGAVGAGAHALHEQVEIARMAERAALLVLLLLAPLPEEGTRDEG
jgi:glutamate carboxypeptidase